jgi:hypothetical protein
MEPWLAIVEGRYESAVRCIVGHVCRSGVVSVSEILSDTGADQTVAVM